MDLLLFLSIIIAPQNAPIPDWAIPAFPILRYVALSLEIEDGAWYIPSNAVGKAERIREWRARLVGMAGYPRTEDCAIFPRHDTINEYYQAVLQARRTYEEKRGMCGYWQELEDHIYSLERREVLIGTLYDATNPMYSRVYRREALQRYRTMVGPTRYYSGFVPGVMP